MPKRTILNDDTICAVATPAGEGAIHLIRISGNKTRAVVTAVFRAGKKKKKIRRLVPRNSCFGYIVDDTGTVLDEVLLTFFKSPHTYTGDDLAEFTIHGNYLLAQRILRLMIKQGARLAERGEFTKRAFLNGKMDLTQAEAVHELIAAKTAVGVDVAFSHLEGSLRQEIGTVREQIVALLSEVEAYVDFPDEDIEVYSQKKLRDSLHVLTLHVVSLQASYDHGAIIREGVRAVIVGKPNVGKSSLLNTLLRRDRALVSAVPGTTRDSLEELLDIKGILFRVIDTAGIRKRATAIEQMGIARTEAYLTESQLVIFVLDGSVPFSHEDRSIMGHIMHKNVIVVVNKADLPQRLSRGVAEKTFGKKNCIVLSTKTRAGIEKLERALVQRVWQGKVAPDAAMLTSERQYAVLSRVHESLNHARTAFDERVSLEFLAFDLREALDALAELVGAVYTDDILDVVFKKFCIGK